MFLSEREYLIDDGKLENGGETSQEKEGEIENKKSKRTKER